ncbi:MAG: hypothetical protein Q4P08_01475 [Eubacteriales bacterium]|nr:hypothetical protein [Eubacteriales bacterium]
MYNFYLQSEVCRLLVSFLVFLAVGFQTASLIIYSLRRKAKGQAITPRLCFEGLLLLLVIFNIYRVGIIQLGPNAELIPWTVAKNLRTLLILALSISNLVLLHEEKNYKLIVYPLLSLAFLDFTEQVCGDYYIYLFAALHILIGIRSILLILHFSSQQNYILSSNSVKEAINALDTGILFFKENGLILLFNQTMEQLMYTMTGKLHRDAIKFYSEYLAIDNCKPDCQRIETPDYLAYTLADGKIWLFTITELKIKAKSYYQLSASDITEIWQINQKLKEQERRLEEHRQQLQEALNDIRYWSKVEATLDVKNRLHDVLGQRIALLMRNVEAGIMPDEESLKTLFNNLRSQLEKSYSIPDIRLRLKRHQKMLSDVGVKLEIRGQLPADEELANFLGEAIIESSTNAIRHGFASLITVEIDYLDHGLSLTVVNNGQTQEGTINYGSGLRRIELKTLSYNGIMNIVGTPQFTLHLELPGAFKGGS